MYVFIYFVLFLWQRSDHFLACCCLSYCGLGERFKVIVSLMLSFHIPRFPSCHPCSHHFLYSPLLLWHVYSAHSFFSRPPLSPSWSCVTPLCLNPAVVLIVFLPPGEPNNEIPFGNQDLSAWRDVHVFIYLNVYSFTWLGSLSAVFWPVFFFAFSSFSHIFVPLVWCF